MWHHDVKEGVSGQRKAQEDSKVKTLLPDPIKGHSLLVSLYFSEPLTFLRI